MNQLWILIIKCFFLSVTHLTHKTKFSGDVPLVEGEEKVEAIKDDDIPDNQEEGVDDNSDSEDEEGDKRM